MLQEPSLTATLALYPLHSSCHEPHIQRETEKLQQLLVREWRNGQHIVEAGHKIKYSHL